MADKKEYTVEELMKLFNTFRSYKSKILPEWRLMRSLYRGDFWKEFSKNLKDYTMTPDWNYLEYTIQAYLNSIYAGSFIGTVTPVVIDDEDAVTKLNAFIQYNWNKWGMKNRFLQIGENGELYNIGAIRVEWDSNDSSVRLEDVEPSELYFDPSVTDYRKGRAIFIERSVNIDTIKNDPKYKEKVEEYIKKQGGFYTDKTVTHTISGTELNPTADNKQVSLIECFIRNDNDLIEQYFILDEQTIIYSNTSMGLHCYPIAVYMPQRPDGNPYGRSKLQKILNTVITLNLLDSMEATQPYRLLNRVRFIDVESKVNIRAFSEYGNTPGASFEVKGDPTHLVHYLDVPQLGDLTNLKTRLENSIFQITGVDPYYKGRMTNSIQTTGATQAFQARVTMLTDNSRITMLEEFCESITRMIIEFYQVYGKGHEYLIPKKSATGTNKIVATTSFDFGSLEKDNHKVKFDYMINASVLLPMNQANLFESAKALFEMQGQYQFKTPVITEEDLIRYSDFPQKDLILQRLERDKQQDTAEDLVSDLTNFASIFSKFLSQGLSQEEAAQQAISVLVEEKNAMKQDPSLGRGLE